MSAETRKPSIDPIQQADLILRLYELRRESVMRKARSYIGGEFLPASADELVEIVTAGNKRSSFVHNGALTPTLVYDTCQEMYFQYAKIQPYLAEFRQKMNLPEWMINIERLIEGSDSGRERIATMRKNLAAIAEARSRQPPA